MPIESVRSSRRHALARQHGAMEYSEAPVDLDVVRNYRLSRLREQMGLADVAGLLLFDQINTRYATDATNMQVWCSHYETRCVFVALEGHFLSPLASCRPPPLFLPAYWCLPVQLRPDSRLAPLSAALVLTAGLRCGSYVGSCTGLN